MTFTRHILSIVWARSAACANGRRLTESVYFCCSKAVVYELSVRELGMTREQAKEKQATQEGLPAC